MTKYKEYFNKMLEENKELFEAFRKLHEKYQNDQDALQDEFNALGRKVQGVANDYENRLCKHSEKGGYSQYTPKLSEKFQAEIKKEFPFYDHIGLIVQKPLPKPSQHFSLKKISV